MRTSEQIIAEIEERLGFVPPFFKPGAQTPQVLENLWQQTMSAYVENPLPALLKEKLSAYLSRYCTVPYWMICHSCSLHSLAVRSEEILALLESPPPTPSEIDDHLRRLTLALGELKDFSELNTVFAENLLYCTIFISLEEEQADFCRSELRRLLGSVNYQHLIAFVAYVRTCHTWMEAHPEVAYADDKRVIDHLATLLEEEPGLADFFQNYVERVRHEPHFWANRLVQNTQRQEAEEALRQSEEQFRGTFNSAAVGIAHVDLEGKWLLVNQKLCDILGYTQQELLERTLQNITHPDDLDTDLGYVRQMLANEIQTYLMEKRYIRKDTSLVWINLTASLIRTPLGEPEYFIAVIEDITERKQAEEARQQQTERERLVELMTQRLRQSLNLQEILNTTVAEVRQFLACDRVFIHRFESDGSGIAVVESVAPGWISILDTQVQGSYLVEATGETYKQGRIQAIADIYAAGLNQRHINFLAQFQVRAILVVPILQEKKLWGLLIAHHCLEPRQWQPLEIELLNHLASQAGIAIQQSELYQQVRQINSTLECQVQERTAQLQRSLEFEATLKRITDKVRDSLNESQLLHVAMQELVLTLDLICCDTSLYNLADSTSTIRYEYIASSAEGTPTIPSSIERTVQMADFPEVYRQLRQGQYFQFCEITPDPIRSQVAILACPIVDDQDVLGDLWLFNHKQDPFDELEIRLIQQVANQCAISIRQARLYTVATAQVESLEKLNALKDDFLSTVSHELRTPISNMKMALSMLKTSPTDERRERYLEILQAECTRESELIDELLDLQRLEAGAYDISLSEAVNIQDFLPNLIEPFRVRTGQREQTLQVNLPPDLPSLVSDRPSLERILAELLNNACKYTSAGGEIVLSVCYKSTEAATIFTISNPAEIPAAQLPRIFEKFYRIPKGDRWKQGGTGLGLTLVQKLAEQIQGTIRVESSRGWTTFTVVLPNQPKA